MATVAGAPRAPHRLPGPCDFLAPNGLAARRTASAVPRPRGRWPRRTRAGCERSSAGRRSGHDLARRRPLAQLMERADFGLQVRPFQADRPLGDHNRPPHAAAREGRHVHQPRGPRAAAPGRLATAEGHAGRAGADGRGRPPLGIDLPRPAPSPSPTCATASRRCQHRLGRHRRADNAHVIGCAPARRPRGRRSPPPQPARSWSLPAADERRRGRSLTGAALPAAGGIEIAHDDAQSLGVATGDRVRLPTTGTR